MKNIKILVVEDQKIIALEIMERLSDMGYSVVGNAISGNQAIQLATDHVPDIILMDIKLEGNMDGIEAAEKIRNLIGCPIIFLTAYADDKTIQRAKITEPYGYIVKPLDERELRSAIEIALYKCMMERKLKDSELKYKSVIKTMEGLLYIVDSDYNLILHNKTEEGLHKSENQKCYSFLYGLDSTCSHCSADKLRQGLTTRMEIFDKNSSRSFYRISTPVILQEGNNYFQHYLVDITERKKNEESIISILHEKDILLREIYHRVKNNMQLTLSLIRLQEAKVTDKAVKANLKTIESRISAMSVIHEDLYVSTKLSKIHLSNYLQKLVKHIVKANSDNDLALNILYDIDNLFVSIDNAIRIGIIVNEVITNSLKHAFIDRTEGEIKVKFNNKDGIYFLEITDNGRGIPANMKSEESTGLGLQIINSMSEQFQYQPEFFNDGGTHFKMKLPSVK